MIKGYLFANEMKMACHKIMNTDNRSYKIHVKIMSGKVLTKVTPVAKRITKANVIGIAKSGISQKLHD